MFTKPLPAIAAAIVIAFAMPIVHAADEPATAEHDHNHGSTEDGGNTSTGLAEGETAKPPMERMHELHEKMKAARTPEERQAAKAEHDKAMKEMMGKMKEMKAMAPEGGPGLEGRMQILEQRMGAMDLAMRMQILEQRMDRTMRMMTRHHGMGEHGGHADTKSAK